MEKNNKVKKYKEAIFNWLKNGVELNAVRKGLENDPEISDEDMSGAACDAMMDFSKYKVNNETTATKFFNGGDAS